VRPTLFETVLPFTRALEIVLGAAAPVNRTETVALDAADGRVAAARIDAAVDVPAFDRAAMDGYAVVAEDTRDASRTRPRVLRRVASLFTGDVPTAGIAPGECVEIATGAPLPPGATAVVMVEETEREGDAVRVMAAVRAGVNVGRRAADIAAGDPVVSVGDVLSPSRIGAVAAVGVASIDVFDRPLVTLLSTGNEVVPPGAPIAGGQVYDVNRFTMGAVVRAHGGRTRSLPPAGDTMDDLHAAFDRAAGSDVIVFSGGSSVGGRDLMGDVLRARGDVLFHGIAVKPGKPTLFGRADAALVFGMPGYPTSCLSNAYMLLVPLVRAMARLPPWTPRTLTLPLATRVVSTPNRHQFYTVRIVNERAAPAFKASGDITSMANADGYFEIPVGVDAVEAGTIVEVKLF
jgi:molybdenum cofactor synthesis domain-containing protein